MSILSKFENVEIKNDTRIAADDLEFCEKNQRLYSKVLNNYKNVYAALMKALEMEKAQFEEIESENTIDRNGYVYKKYDYHFISMNKEDFTKVIIGVHDTFIKTIFNYFIKKYGVDLEIKSAEEILGFEKPEKNHDSYWGFRGCTDEEIEKIKKKNEEYEKSLDEYRDKVILAEINFNNIIDDIFIQLDGYSFADRSKKEIIDNCKNACFNEYRKFNYAELKKDKIVIETGFHSHFDTIWKEYEAETDNNSFKAIMRALSFFDSEERYTSIYSGWLCEFVFYSKKEKDGIYGIHTVASNKIESFKFYKNGKWEVKFNSQDEAQKFFDMYCKVEV